ncbi:MAG: hypothetical protein M3Y55_16070 [Pseudomonadota bacterium]|nr:hypothetical protein [Pseudomonadota bacterium]
MIEVGALARSHLCDGLPAAMDDPVHLVALLTGNGVALMLRIDRLGLADAGVMLFAPGFGLLPASIGFVLPALVAIVGLQLLHRA